MIAICAKRTALTVYFSLGYTSVTASLLRALSKQFIPVRLHQKPVRIGFMHFREPARKLLNTNELMQHLEIVLPKPGSEVQILSGRPVITMT
jgi:hypothetical protein